MLLLGIKNVFVSIGVWIVSGIYKVAAWSFEIFIILADSEFLSNDSYKNVIDNCYIILGIVLLFILAFSLLKAMVNPDDQKQGTANVKKVIVNLITSCLIMILLPFVFTFAFDFQHSIISKYNVIGKFFGYGSLGQNDSPTSSSNLQVVREGAYTIVNGVFTAFFNVNTDNCELESGELGTEGLLAACQNLVFADKNLDFGSNYEDYGAKNQKDKQSLYSAINYVGVHGNFNLYNAYSEQVEDEKIEFNFLLSLIAGCILVYVAVSFCFDMAIRMIKLVFYQLIAPVPIFFRVIPEGKLSGTFNQWLKIVIACYLEVYIRILVFYLCLFLCDQLVEAGFFEQVSSGYGPFLGLLAKAFVLMGLVTFMRQAPKLVSEVTGINSGNMKLGIREKLKDGGFFAAGSAAGALITSRGNPLAAIRAGKAGWKNGDFKAIGGEAKRRQEYKDALESGATRRQLLLNSFRGAFGFDSTADAVERRIKTGKTSVENNSTNAIEYVDGKGNVHTILSGAAAEIDDVTAEELKAKKTQNVGAMSDANDKMRDLDKQIKWAGSQKGWKSAMDDEADKKFNDGKYEHDIRYMDANGNIYQERVNGKRLSELSQQGMKFLYADESRDKFKASYTDNEGNIHDIQKDLSRAELDNLISQYGESRVQSSRVSVTEKKIRDEVRATFSTNELSSDSPNLIKNKTEAFFTTLANEKGFNYQSYVYDENGRQLYNADGTAVIETGGFASTVKNGERIITHNFTDENGTQQKVEYKSIGNGMLEYKDEKGNRKEMSIYDLSDMFDQKSKSTTGVLEAQKQAIAEGEEFIRARDENEAIDAILKQRDEKVAEALQDQKQRGREAAKKYRANRK